MARPERFERPTPWFVAKYSIQLSYGRAAFSKRRILQTNERLGKCFFYFSSYFTMTIISRKPHLVLFSPVTLRP